MTLSRDFTIDGYTTHVEIPIKRNGNGMEYAANFILQCLEALSESSYNFVFPRRDTKLKVEFGTDDCILGINFDKYQGNEFVLESNINKVLRELKRGQYSWSIDKTMLYRFMLHEMQHVRNGPEMKAFFDAIDAAAKSGKITWNENWLLLAASDMKFEGLAETVENDSKPLKFRGEDNFWFRRKSDKFPEIKARDEEELKAKLKKHYEKAIRMEDRDNHARYVNDNYITSRGAVHLIGADNFELKITDVRGAPVGKDYVGNILMLMQDKGKVLITIPPDIFREVYEYVNSLGLCDFFEHYEKANNTLEIPEQFRAIDIKAVKQIFEKLKAA
jgi:hypothetical protein